MQLELASPIRSAARDPELVARAQRGELRAFEELIAPRLDKLFRTACGILRDPSEAEDATAVPGAPGGFLSGYDEHTVWVSDQQQVRRVTPADGKVVATIPVTYGGLVRQFGDHAWMIQESTAAMRVDVATSEVTKTIPILYGPVVGIEAAGYLWVPTMDGNKLWRIAL